MGVLTLPLCPCSADAVVFAPEGMGAPISDAAAHGRARGPVARDAENRERDHFFPTPPHATLALLNEEKFEGNIWEPAAGDGAMSRVLEAAGYNVLSTDLIDRGYCPGGRDFLLDYETMADNIVTNPPFYLAEEFLEHALTRSRRKVALLCRLAWLEGKERGKTFRARPPARVWVFSSRVQMARSGTDVGKGGGGMVPFCWMVWEAGHVGRPELWWLP